MNVLTEMPMSTYFEQLFQSKIVNGNYSELFDHVITNFGESPADFGKYLLIKHEDNMENEVSYYLFDMDANAVQKSATVTDLHRYINKKRNFVATNFQNIPIRGDNKVYVQLGVINQEIINELEILCQSANTSAAGMQ